MCKRVIACMSDMGVESGEILKRDAKHSHNVLFLRYPHYLDHVAS